MTSILKSRPKTSQVRIEDCSSFVIDDGDVEHHPHAGESITLWVPHTVAGRRRLADFAQRLAAGAMAFSDPEAFDILLDIAADHVVEWTWTGADGDPLPLPSADREAVAGETDWPELLWIFNAVLARKDPGSILKKESSEGNGSAPSQSNS